MKTSFFERRDTLWRIMIPVLICVFFFWAIPAQAIDDANLKAGIWYHSITVLSILVFKVAVLLVGYLIAKLGYDLLLKGVTGSFKFHTEFKGTTADLISASPGVFFILMATIIIGVAILKQTTFETTLKDIPQITDTTGVKGKVESQALPPKPSLPENPPKKEAEQ